MAGDPDLEPVRAAGFDLVHELDLAWLDDDVDAGPVRAAAGRRGVLVANTRALWPVFLAARRADPALAASPDPLDAYTEQTIARAFPGARVWFTHRHYAGRFLPFQRIAVAAGLGTLAPTGLVIHPVFGPWIGLRALVALDGEPPAVRPAHVAYTCRGDCPARLAEALQSRDTSTATAVPEPWRRWLGVRDACQLGREYRYSDDQVAYHYSKDLAVLP